MTVTTWVAERAGAEVKPTLLARDIMHADVITVREDDDVWQLARVFTSEGVSGAPVVDGSGRLIGVVSLADIVRHLREVVWPRREREAFYSDAEPDRRRAARRALCASDLMNPAIHAQEDCPVETLSMIMLQHRIHRIIITSGASIRGIVTTMDLVKAV